MHTSIVTPDSHAGTISKVFTEVDERNVNSVTVAPAWEQLHMLQLTARQFENQVTIANIDTPGMRFGFESHAGDLLCAPCGCTKCTRPLSGPATSL